MNLILPRGLLCACLLSSLALPAGVANAQSSAAPEVAAIEDKAPPKEPAKQAAAVEAPTANPDIPKLIPTKALAGRSVMSLSLIHI